MLVTTGQLLQEVRTEQMIQEILRLVWPKLGTARWNS